MPITTSTKRKRRRKKKRRSARLATRLLRQFRFLRAVMVVAAKVTVVVAVVHAELVPTVPRSQPRTKVFPKVVVNVSSKRAVVPLSSS